MGMKYEKWMLQGWDRRQTTIMKEVWSKCNQVYTKI